MSSVPDLHTHSTASDGTLSPTDLVQRAAAAGVPLLALTDHDTTEGVAEAAAAAAGLGLGLVPGVEISVTWAGRTVHIIGLGVDGEQPGLKQGLARIRESRDWRAEEMGRRLAKAGIDGACDGARVFANGGLIGRTHFARFLVERQAARTEREAFKRYLGDGRPGYVPGEWATLEEAVTWIRDGGGRAVIAHPARYKLTRTRLLQFIGAFRDLGGVGIEVVCGSHSRDDAFNFARHAREQGLLASAGSDFHGPQLALHEHAWMDLGRLPPLPDGCTPIWHDWTCESPESPDHGLGARKTHQD